MVSQKAKKFSLLRRHGHAAYFREIRHVSFFPLFATLVFKFNFPVVFPLVFSFISPFLSSRSFRTIKTKL